MEFKRDAVFVIFKIVMINPYQSTHNFFKHKDILINDIPVPSEADTLGYLTIA